MGQMGSAGEDSDEGRVNLANVDSRSRGTALEFDRRRDGGSNGSGPVADPGRFEACEEPGKPGFSRRTDTGGKTTARPSAYA